MIVSFLVIMVVITIGMWAIVCTGDEEYEEFLKDLVLATIITGGCFLIIIGVCWMMLQLI